MTTKSDTKGGEPFAAATCSVLVLLILIVLGVIASMTLDWTT